MPSSFSIVSDVFTWFSVMFFFQLWCAAGVNLSGGRAAHALELTKQARGSQSSLDQLEQENKVRRNALWSVALGTR